jgi:hypothetical protein
MIIDKLSELRKQHLGNLVNAYYSHQSVNSLEVWIKEYCQGKQLTKDDIGLLMVVFSQWLRRH